MFKDIKRVSSMFSYLSRLYLCLKIAKIFLFIFVVEVMFLWNSVSHMIGYRKYRYFIHWSFLHSTPSKRYIKLLLLIIEIFEYQRMLELHRKFALHNLISVFEFNYWIVLDVTYQLSVIHWSLTQKWLPFSVFSTFLS